MTMANFLGVLICALLVFSWTPGGSAQSAPCTTPSRESGSCVAIERCKNIWKEVSSSTPDPRYEPWIKAAACTLPGVQRSICCQLAEVGPEVTNRFNPDSKEKLPQELVPGGSDPSAPCTTPSRESGSCVAIERCKNIWKVVSSSSPDPRYEPWIKAAACTLPGVQRSICCQLAEVNLQQVEVGLEMNRKIIRPGSTTKLPLDCGKSVNDRIANGNVTRVFEYPWMAMLRYKHLLGGYIEGCGGSLINKRYVLTAAHCIKTKSTLKLEYVRLGEHDKRTEIDCNVFKNSLGVEIERDCAEPVEEFKVESTVVHPDFNRPYFSNDIGLVRLDRDVTFKYHIRPICLPVTPELQSESFERYVVAGWGTTENKTGSDVLLQAIVPRVSNEVCQQKMTRNFPMSNFQIGDKQMCAGGEDKVDSCEGDSGGPLGFSSTYNNGVRFVQYGVVSAGIKSCGEESTPGLYARVASYMDWILENMAD